MRPGIYAPDAQGKVAALYIRATSETGELVVIKRLSLYSPGYPGKHRILLRNTIVCRPGLRRPHWPLLPGTPVGQNWSVRFKGNPPKKNGLWIPARYDGSYIRRRFPVYGTVLAAKNLLNTAICSTTRFIINPRHRSGAMSFMYLEMLVPILAKNWRRRPLRIP